MHTHRLNRWNRFLGALALAAGLCAAAPVQAQAYPSRPVRWVVPFPPGGAMDVIARTLAERMSQSMGQQVLIENRPGAGGNIGSEAVARSAPDGYTVMVVSIGHAVNPSLYAKMSFDAQKDFEPVALLAVVPNLLVSHPSLPAKSVREVIELARAQPGRLTYASAGNGTSIHLAGELFASMAKVDMVHVPYKGSGPAVTDLIGGQVNLMFDSITSAQPHVKAGKLRAYAVTTARRSRTLPDMPTIAESGLPGYDLSPWFAVFAPAKTPRPVIERLNAEMLRAMKLPEVQQRFDSIGAETIGSTPEELGAHLQRETALWSRILRERGIKAD
jgi:tripartite-type tricarboxylate transporter receptor subunit TctC